MNVTNPTGIIESFESTKLLGQLRPKNIPNNLVIGNIIFFSDFCWRIIEFVKFLEIFFSSAS